MMVLYWVKVGGSDTGVGLILGMSPACYSRAVAHSLCGVGYDEIWLKAILAIVSSCEMISAK